MSLSTRQLAKRRRAAVERAMKDAITREQAKEAGLVSQTQGFSMRRWDFASACMNQLENLKRTASHRKPTLVQVSPQCAEIWALPLAKQNPSNALI